MYEHLILEKLHPEDISLDSFEIKPKLNPKIWANDSKVRPEVRKQLLKIADDFYESLDIPWVEIKDVKLTGSLANYNWSKYSDVDLHIVINYKDINNDKDLVTEYLKLKKDKWNDDHHVKLNGFNIELYAQDYKEEHSSTGVYSLENNEWIRKPKKQTPTFDKEVVRKKAADIVNQIEDIEKEFKAGKYNDVIKAYKSLWEKIKSMRKRGLNRIGEYSIENIVFKVLRRGEYLEKLTDLKNQAYDLENSLKISEEA